MIWVLLVFLLTGCSQPTPVAETPYVVSSPRLAAIDTLMQTRPDSALLCLLDSTEDDPYYHLLLSEALYKNDYAIVNGQELLAATAHFDSVGDAFLSARCHYMNGAAYYEMDSIVLACAEYLKALEVMNDHFAEKDLAGPKAKFMALTYTRLTDLFSDTYLHEQTIYFGKQSLAYYHKYPAEPWHIAWVLDEIGSQFAITGQWDSTNFYCDMAVKVLPDTNNQTYRDIAALQSLLSYSKGKAPQKVLEQLRKLLSQAENQQEYWARCLNISEVFYHEKDFDSATVYLKTVFYESPDINSKKQAAEWLIEICKFQREDPQTYVEFLIPFANQEENKSAVKSQLTELYHTFGQKKLERQHQQTKAKDQKRFSAILVGVLFMTLVVIILYHRKKDKVGDLQKQIVEEQAKTMRMRSFDHFLNEAICQEILLSTQGKNIKRSAVPSDYPNLALNDLQLQQLTQVVNRHFGPFESRLEQRGIIPNPNLVNLCHLYLLGLNEKQISILLSRDYSSIKRYEKKLKNGFKTQEDLTVFLKRIVLQN